MIKCSANTRDTGLMFIISSTSNICTARYDMQTIPWTSTWLHLHTKLCRYLRCHLSQILNYQSQILNTAVVAKELILLNANSNQCFMIHSLAVNDWKMMSLWYVPYFGHVYTYFMARFSWWGAPWLRVIRWETLHKSFKIYNESLASN